MRDPPQAYADRARYLGDPAFVHAPIATLLAQNYAAQQRDIEGSKPSPAPGHSLNTQSSYAGLARQ